MQEIYVRKCAVCDVEKEFVWKDVSRWIRNNPGRALDQWFCPSCATKFRNTTYGESKTALYNRWKAMFARTRGQGGECAKKYYFEKGIVVCPEWADFTVFKKWAMANGFSQDLVIDRIDGDGPYSPEDRKSVV